MAPLNRLYRTLAHNRVLLAIILGSFATLVLGAGVLRATVWAPLESSITVCVDKKGKLRVVTEKDKGRKEADPCK